MKQDKGDFMLEFFEWQIRNKQTLTFWISFTIIILSLFTIGFVIYFQFLWEPQIQCDFDEYGYWGFEVICSDDYFGENNINKTIDKHHYFIQENCQKSLDWFREYQNCKIVG